MRLKKTQSQYNLLNNISSNSNEKQNNGAFEVLNHENSNSQHDHSIFFMTHIKRKNLTNKGTRKLNNYCKSNYALDKTHICTFINVKLE